MKTPQEILDLYRVRLASMGRLFAQMREVRDAYNADIAVPLSELNEGERPAVSNLTQQGMDGLARRVASVLPNVTYLPDRAGFEKHETSARDRKRVNMGWWADTHLKRKLGLRSRHWLGYATSPALVVPDAAHQRPDWGIYSPLDTFPAPTQPTDMTPDDCIFASRHTLTWLKSRYPLQAMMVHKVGEPNDDMEFVVLRYNDAGEDSLIVVGHDPDNDRYGYNAEPTPGSEAVVLEQVPNRAEVPWAVVPGRITLDRPLGHFDGIIGMYQTQAMLMAMEVIATQRAIWPREWIVARQNEIPEVVQIPRPETGEPGVVKGGDFDRQQLDPSFAADRVMDRLEHAQRMTAGLPAEFGGMASTNVRTGRRGAQLISASIDPTVAEAQDVFAEALYEENRRAIAIDKAYFRAPKSYFVSARGHRGKVEYTAPELWKTDAHVVEYPMAGADMESLVLSGGQRVGMGTLSKRSFMELDPLIEDAEAEQDRLKAEGLDDAFFASLQTMAADPTGPWQPIHLAKLKHKIIAENVPWEKAVDELQKEIQAQQATPAPTPADAMPGLSMPGQGVEAPPAVPESEPSMQNLTSLLSQLGVQQMATRSRT